MDSTSTYTQQERYLIKHDDDICPRDAIIRDLCGHLKEWCNQGDYIILMGDFNGNTEGQLRWNRELTDSGVYPANSKLGRGRAPATYQIGSLPIDGMFISDNITHFQLGYLPFGYGPSGSDHRCIWMDITFCQAFGNKLPPLIKPQARRLKVLDPKIRNKYTKSME